MKFTKLKNAIMFALLSVLLAVTVSFGAVFATNSINADARTISTTTYALGTSSTYKSGFQSLHNAITGGTSYNYNALVTAVKAKTKDISTKDYYFLTSAKFRGNKSDGKDVVVTFGGYTWILTCVSIANKTATLNATKPAQDGNVIATFILANHDGKSIQFSTYTGTGDYPSAMYSSSYLRSYLTGSKYSTGTGSAPSTTYNIKNNVTETIWQKFTKDYKSYLVQPKYLGWQEHQDASYDLTGSDGDYIRSNDGYGTPLGNLKWHTAKPDYTTKSGYGDWKEDYIWVPSSCELGLSSNTNNIWECLNDIKCTDSGYSWFRSASHWNANATRYGSSPGLGGTAANQNSYVRPCIHVDLKVLGGACGAYDTPVAAPTWNGGGNADKTYTYDGTEKTVTYYSLPANVSVSADRGTLDKTNRTLKATNAGTYTLTFSVASGYCWADDYTNTSKTLKLVINKVTVTPHTWYTNNQGTGVTRVDSTHVTATYSGADTYAETSSSSAKNDANVVWKFSSTHLTWDNSTNDRIHFTNAGDYTLTMTLPDNTNYVWSDASTNTALARYLYISVSKKDISSGVTWSDIGPYTYDGNEKKPMPSIYKVGDNVVNITIAATYTYSNNINAGIASVTVTASGSANYTGTATLNFTINKSGIPVPYWYSTQDSGITVSGTTATATYKNELYTFKAYEDPYMSSPAIPDTVGLGYYDSVDCFRLLTATNANTYTVSWTIGSSYRSNYQWSDGTDGATSKSLTIVINKARVSALYASSATYTYNGTPQGKVPTGYDLTTTVNNQPAVTDLIAVNYSGTANDGTTWNSSTKPTKAGNYGITYQVADAYRSNYMNNSGESYIWTGSFTINRKNVSSGVDFTYISSYIFSGNENRPTPTVNKVGSTVVTSAVTEFSYSYADNVNAGTATVIVTGEANGNYTGTKSLQFTITKAVVNSITWDSLTFAYSGAEQCPELSALTTATEVLASAKPLSMFEITGGQTDAGNHTVTATLKPEYACNFTVSATDESATQLKTEYVINKAELSISFTVSADGIRYSGLAQLPETVFTVPSTVIESACPALNDLKMTLKAQLGSHLTKGGAVDVGDYTVTYNLPSGLAKNFTLNNGTPVTISFTISKAALNMTWTWTGSKPYNGSKQGPEVEEFTNVPEHGEDPQKCVSITYYGTNGEKLTGAPVHQGSYSVTVKFTSENYGFADGTVITEPSKTINFTITPVSYGDVTWQDLTGLKFTGKPQGPVLVGDYYGLFTGDSATKLNLSVTYAQYGETEFVTDKYTNAGKYIVRVTEEHGDYTFEAEEFDIAKREVWLTWTGDKYSRTDGDAIKWLYDGKAHKPDYTVSFGDGVEIYRGSTVIDSLKLDYNGRTVIGSEIIKAVLSEDDYNLNFEIADGTENISIEIEKFVAEKVEWYEYGGSEALNDEQLASLRYEYSMVYGTDGPKLSAKAIMIYPADEGDIAVFVDLYVRYPSYHTGYWWDKNGETEYKAIAEYKTADANNGSMFSEEAADKVTITFLVTDLRTDLEKITISWVITVDGEKTDIKEIGEYDAAVGYGWLNGEFTYCYNGEKQYPTPVAVNAEGRYVYVTVTENGKHSEVGSYTVHLSAMNGYEFNRAESECRYGIAPREITVTWLGEDSFEYTGEVPHVAAMVGDDSVNTLLSEDTLKATVSGADTGTHKAIAAVYTGGKVNNNYKISNAEKAITITRKPVSVKNIDWSKTKEAGATESLDASGKIYYVWVNDGKVHSPVAELSVEVLGEKHQLSIIVLGSASATGTYTAYAVLDESDGYNNNFVLVADETNHTETIASQRFDISKISITKITWSASKDGGEKLEYVYDGKEHLPYAVCETSDGRTLELNVFGGQTDAGTYTAYVTDNYSYDSGAKKSASYTILPKPVKVTWGEETEFIYDGLAHHPEAVAEGLTGEDYYVTSKTDAGKYLAELVFTNTNYTCENSKCAYTILKREVTVSWTGSGYTPGGAEEGVLYYTYNAAERCPAASGSFMESIANRITVSGREVNVGKYEAVAALDSSIPENANYTLKNSSKRYEILPYEITVVWTGNEDGTYEWEYDGNPHAPTAKYKLWNDEWQDAEVLGARVNAGENYIASVTLPENCVFAKVGGVTSGEHKYTVKKCVVNRIEWYADTENITDKTVFTYEYNGLAQVPVAKVPETGEELIVTGAMINAGSGYIAVAALKDEGNYEFGTEVNNEYEYGIRAKTVWIKWLGNTDGTFTWEYTGELISPEAQLEDKDHNVIVEDGKPVKVTVTGANIQAGDSYKATAHDTFTNYDFAKDASVTRNYKITAISLGDDFTWEANGGTVTDGKYTYGYNGKVHQPTAKAEGKPGILFSYTITDKDGNEVTAILNAGEYEVTATASDGNVTIPNPTVTVLITAKEVEVEWEDVTNKLPYTGTAQAPKAYYTDINGLKVELEVIGGVISGSGQAEADFAETDNEYGNYVIKADSAKTSFEVEEKTTGNYVYNWATGKFELEPEQPETAA